MFISKFNKKIQNMRSLCSFLFLVFVCTIPLCLCAQSFEKGNKIINAGIKISIYKVTNSNEDDDGDGAAISYTIPIGFEYAVGKSIGVGAEIGICNYFTSEDSITGVTPKANSFDVLLKGNFHWLKSSRVNMSSGLGLGISNFTYKSNDDFESVFKSTGPYIRISLIDFKVYFTKNFGMTAIIGVPIMNFSNGRITDKPGSDFNYPLKFAGGDIGTGFVLKF